MRPERHKSVRLVRLAALRPKFSTEMQPVQLQFARLFVRAALEEKHNTADPAAGRFETAAATAASQNHSPALSLVHGSCKELFFSAQQRCCAIRAQTVLRSRWLASSQNQAFKRFGASVEKCREFRSTSAEALPGRFGFALRNLVTMLF